MAPHLGSYGGEDSSDEDGRNSPTSSPCELTYNNLFERINCLSSVQAREFAEVQKAHRSIRTRTVSRIWPRDPQGKTINPDNSPKGKQTPNGQPYWGETISDFYRVQSSPGIPKSRDVYTISTGSRLASWMTEEGELQWAVDELNRAEIENEPEQIKPWHVRDSIKRQEQKIRSKACGWGRSMPKKRGQEESAEIFNSSNYPAPWPLIPFSYPIEKLQHRIKYHRLPQKLIVHDPWRLLSAAHPQHEIDSVVSWVDMPDITKSYRLEPLERMDVMLSTVEQTTDLTELDGFFLDLLEVSSDPIVPPIYVVHSPPPEHPSIQEAHIYLSPAHFAGSGSHSNTYRAELELPRDALTPFIICKECVKEEVAAKLKEEDGNNGERMDQKWKTKSTIVELKGNPKLGNQFLSAKCNTDYTSFNHTDGCIISQPVSATSRIQVRGPIRCIQTSVPWRNISHPAICNHPQSSHDNIHPPTAKVCVAAKIATDSDHELSNEAKNYREFAPHLFDHFTGFNLITPLEDPVPVGAVVPQFYGYYVPDSSADKQNGSEGDTDDTFLSSILLLEDCGTPTNIDDLSADDRQECASLCYRFHCDNWIHGSFSVRKILVQPGPINAPPKDRRFSCPTLTPEDPNYLESVNDQQTRSSFRLIGFKKSLKSHRMEHRNEERETVKREFGV